jgi:hypothetical protein
MKLAGLERRSILKNKNLWEALFLVIFIVLYKPPIFKEIEKLFESVFYVVMDIRSFRSNLATPQAGEHILPPSVQEMLRLLRNQNVAFYRVSERIKSAEGGLLYQRIVESAWPRKISPECHHEFVFISELERFPKCKEVGRGKEVALVLCR